MRTLIDIQNYVKPEYEEIENPSENTQFYLTRFADNPNKKWFISWNWSAFLSPINWLAYRKMYCHSLLFYGSVYVCFLITCFLIGLITGIMGLDIANPSYTNVLGYYIILLYLFLEIISRTFLGFYGNSIYLHNLKQRIYRKSKRRGTSDIAVLLAIGFNIITGTLALFFL